MGVNEMQQVSKTQWLTRARSAMARHDKNVKRGFPAIARANHAQAMHFLKMARTSNA